MSEVAVIGSGIIGLTTALEIQAKGHHVIVFADALPGDQKSTMYTSPWAGAHHLMVMGDDPKKREYEHQTFDRLWAESEENSEEIQCIMQSFQKEFYEEDITGKTELDHMPEFRELTSDELIPPATCGIAFKTVTIDTATYLPFLLSRFLGRGGQIRRQHIQHIDQVALGAWGTPIPNVLVVCAGIGTRFLGGVEDKYVVFIRFTNRTIQSFNTRDVYPVRGQTVLIHAPWLCEGRGLLEKDGCVTYIIRRRSGDTVIGGTRDIDDWYPHPRLDTGRAILERALKLMPELVPPMLRSDSRPPTVADLEPYIVEHGCGLRPARKGGIRLERDTVTLGDGRRVPVVYNYGHGGAGYQTSWGTASAAARLVEEALANRA